MSFLNKIDLAHKECRSEFNVNELSENFSSFIDVAPIGIILSKRFVIKKQEKAKLLIVSGKQRVYLSDYQIISTILQLNQSYINWFIHAFIELYNNKSKNFKFTVDYDEFEGIGISYYPKSVQILLFSDTIIDINDLIFVINFILSKDHQFEKDNSIPDFEKQTLIKYITLLDYYSNKTERSKIFLKKIGYPLSADFIDVPKTKSMFSKTNLFDISKFF